jgi:MAF protein
MKLAFLLPSTPMVTLILASASPRRQALIQLLGYPVRVCVAGVDELSVTDPDPARNVVETARLKAETVAATVTGEAVIIAADTEVILDEVMLGKPVDADDAVRMLRALRGRTHQVHTGIVVCRRPAGKTATVVSTTDVTMREYSDAEIAAYVATGDPLDKAGAYAIQSVAFRPVAALSGCYTGVVGFSLCRLSQALEVVGVPTSLPVANHEASRCEICRRLMQQPDEL